MTIPTNAYTTFPQIGRREDLQDIIYNISPTDTPFMSSAGQRNVSNTYTEWQTDALAAPNGSNAQIEGDDAVATAVTPTVRAGNYTQILTKTIIVSATADKVTTAGRKTDLAYAIAKAGKELKRDLETILLQNQASVVGNTTTARKMRSLPSWFATNVSAGAGGANGTTSTARTDGTQRALTEALLKTVLQSCWNAGGSPDMLMVGGNNKQLVSGFSGNAQRYMESNKDNKILSGVAVYVSDFGQIDIVPNRFQRARDAHVIERDMFDVGYLRNFTNEALAKTGDAEKQMIVAEATLIAKNEASSGIIADLL